MSQVKTYLWYFFLYSILGWCAEVVFAAIKNRHFVNRGFLNGPLCPIYGSGLVVVLLCLEPLKSSLLWLYLGSVVLTTLLELATGYAMEKLFHQRWWDYSKMPFNIGGYVCLPFSLIWGVACVLIVDGLHRLVARFVSRISEPLGTVLLCAMVAYFIADLCVTLATVAKLNQRLTQLDEVAALLRQPSDKLGAAMAGGALAVAQADEKARAELQKRHAELSERFMKEQKRLLRAFPNLRSTRHEELLQRLKENWPPFGGKKES